MTYATKIYESKRSGTPAIQPFLIILRKITYLYTSTPLRCLQALSTARMLCIYTYVTCPKKIERACYRFIWHNAVFSRFFTKIGEKRIFVSIQAPLLPSQTPYKEGWWSFTTYISMCWSYRGVAIVIHRFWITSKRFWWFWSHFLKFA